jgi:hypothetical protein
MGIHETREEEAVDTVDAFPRSVLPVDLLRCSHGGDGIADDGNGTPLQDGILIVKEQDMRSREDNVGIFHGVPPEMECEAHCL